MTQLGNYQLQERKVFGFNWVVLDSITGKSELFVNKLDALTYMLSKNG